MQTLAHRPSFTLIEMLVVVAIISILAAMLSPSLMKALDSSRTVVCGNNERQQGIAVQLWGQDHDDYAPPSNYNNGTGIGQQIRLDGGSVNKSRLIDKGYVDDQQLFACPVSTVSGEFRGHFDFTGGWAFTYRYGIQLCGNTERDGRPAFDNGSGSYALQPKMSRFPSPGGTVLGADALGFADYLDWGIDHPDRARYDSYGAHFPHATLTRSSVLYLDGHSKAIIPDAINSDSSRGNYYHTIYSRTCNQ